MYKKKLSTIAIITILTLSILLVAIPMASATPITTPTLSAGSGNVGDKITVSATDGSASPFGLVEVYWDTLATKISEGYATSAGNYEIKNVVIPAGIKGDHDVIVKDVLSSTIASQTFIIAPEIAISTKKGLPGDSVTVTGTGFGNKKDASIYLGAITAIAAESVTITPAASVTGTLTQTPVTIGSVTLTCPVSITGTVSGTPTTVTGSVTVTDDGEGNLAGSTTGIVIATGLVDVAITGTINYGTGVITLTASVTDGAGTDPVTVMSVTITSCTAAYDYAEYAVTPGAGVTTSAVGSFSAVIIIPAITEANYRDYDVTAIDTDGNTAAYVTLTVDYYVTVNPISGPAGITITISGRIPASTPYELRIDTTTIATGTSGSDTTFSQTHVISSFLSLAPHTVSVVWATTKTKTTTFTVTAPPQVSFTPTSGVPGTVVTISTVASFPFSAGANITLYLGTNIVNSTQLDDRFGPTVAVGSSKGTFTNLEFTVPALAPGVYTLTVTDQYGASTGTVYTFTVKAAPVTTIALRATSYLQGDTLSFNIVTTETDLVPITVTVRDPSGAIWWTTNAWTLKGTVSKVVQYQDQVVNGNPLILPTDAPVGSWNWTITYTPTSNPVSTKATALFTVAALPDMQDVLDQLDALEATITNVITTTEGDIIAVINTKSGQITTKLDAISPKLQAIEDTAVIIATMLGEVQVDIAALDLDAMGVDITAIKGDVATIKTNIGTVTTSVSALDAKVTTLSGNVATVSTSLGTLEGTVTSIDGNVATIDTEVGTLQADISDIPSKIDMTPVWIAVVLSLIAAIAACFAVVTIRQKIAG